MRHAMFLAGALLALPTAVHAQSNEVSVLHYWTSGGEAAAVGALRNEFEKRSGAWIDEPVAGGGGDTHDQVLRSRTLAGDAPGAAIPKASDAMDWARNGFIADTREAAAQGKWDEKIPASFQPTIKLDGNYVAVPLNVHRFDFMLASGKVLRDNGLDLPKTWDEFNAAADKLKAADITPLAHGGQPWQDEILFDSVVLGIGGADFFQKALVEYDQEALTSETMVKAFEQMRRLRGYVDANFSGRDWNLATAMIIKGEAAFQIHGDWAKGELTAAGVKIGEDVLCAATPRNEPGGYAYVVNSISFFTREKGGAATPGQILLANTVLSSEAQIAFNLAKGSVPPVKGLDLSAFDNCAQESAKDLAAADAEGKLVSAVIGGTVQTATVRGVITDVVTNFFNSDMGAEEAAKLLAEEIEAVK
jgi:glucose/mannose transport system substrate-binding protein